MSKTRFVIFACFFGFLILFGCAHRLPKENSAGKIIERHFHKYGKKFKETDFGKYKVKDVQVIDISEIHKNMAAVTANVILNEGPTPRVRCVLEKKPLGWRFISWENL